MTQQGFGTPLGLFQVPTSIIPTRYALYSSPNEMIDAGFSVDDPAYLWALTVQGQQFSPNQFAIGRRGEGTAQVDTVTITTADEGVWSYSINGISISYTASDTATEVQIAQGLMTALIDYNQNNQNTGIPVIVPGGTLATADFTVTAWVPGEGFVNGGLTAPGTGAGTFANTTPNAAAEDITTALNAVVAENDDWYGLNIEARQDADIIATNTWVASQLKVFVAQSSDPDVPTTTTPNIATQLQATSNTRTQLMWYHRDQDFADGAMLGRALAAQLDDPAPAGQITWAAKQLQVIATSPLNTGQLANIEANGADAYTETKGRGVVWLGRSVEGEFMDVQTTIDWVQSRMGERLFAVIASTPTKVGFDDAGIASLKAEGLGLLREGVAANHFLGDDPDFPRVTVPRSTDVSTTDRNNRILRGYLAEAIIQGAIHKVIVQVALSV